MAKEDIGYVYIFTNESFREGWIKIGKTKNIKKRLNDLDNTSCPLPFDVYATLKTNRYEEAETFVHEYISHFNRDLRVRPNREYFKVSPQEALDIFYQVKKLMNEAGSEIIVYDKNDAKLTKLLEKKYERKFDSSTNNNTLEDVSLTSNPNNRVWLIPYNKKFFDLKGCFEKNGEVYWTQHCHFQAGDTGYIYGSAPESAIRFSFIVKEADLHYDPVMDQDDEFVRGDGPTNIETKGRLFAHMILTGETTNKKLSLSNLTEKGLKGAPMGPMNLSKKELKEFLIYIEENF